MNDWENLPLEVLPRIEEAYKCAQGHFFMGSPMREMLDYHFASGGKRIRPVLVYGAAQAYANQKNIAGGPLLDFCTPYALAVELIHNATLIHDDIQDGDRTRRGADTLWVKYSTAQAINCGDAWFFAPLLLIQEAAYKAEMKLSLLDLIQRKTLAVIEGQSQEFALKERFARAEDISISQYLQMVEGKTSALFSMPLLGGARIAGASEEEQKELEKVALHLGHAFQIQDDLLDLWGDKGRDHAGSDIAEGKLSYPLVVLLSRLGAGSRERHKVETIVRKAREETSQEEVDYVIRMMEKEGVKEQAKADFLRHLKEARASEFWHEVTNYLASWLEEKVQGF
jgi:geranylgeranyl diphosphate synthase type I